MKPLIAVLCLISTVALAQNPQPPVRSRMNPPQFTQQNVGDSSEALPENYQLTLVLSDKDKVVTELSLIVATTDFSVSAADPRISFSGKITPDDQGNVLVRYGLGMSVAVYTGNNMSFQDSTAQASVKVRLGESLQIFKSGTQTYKLTISRLSAETHKSK